MIGEKILNILLINHYAGSLDYGMEFRPFYFAREWVKMGHKVDIIAADYSHLRRKNPVVTNDFQIEIIDGITYHWVKTGSYKGNGFDRAKTMAKFVSKLYLNANKISGSINPDVVIASSTYPLDTFPAKKIANLSNAKLIHEIHDMWPSTLIEIGGMAKSHPFVKLMQYGENAFCRHSDIVVSLLPCAKDYLVEHGMDPKSFRYIPNGIVLDDWKAPKDLPEEHMQLFDKLKKEGKFIVGYFGGHAVSNALDLFIEAANNIDDNSIHFVLVGDGVEKTNLIELANKYQLSNVSFLPPVAKLSIPNVIDKFDCVYIGGKKHSLYRFGAALNKLYDTMMAGKPIIYGVDAPNNDVKDFGCGISVSPGDVDGIMKAITEMKQMDTNELHSMGMKGKNAVLEKYEYTVLANKFDAIFKEK
ncbi:glycosyltransferase family 4 protein [Youngiibacter multivorans]|uniref:Glycosyltransferase involved in cell wall biosynthesis n=1 Tax=Youngiibacter multivorans TaxID=937251 RepID=A0ABS4G397_9CLOT|nr:glycosyltransferase family 4 protein [Youngiibacter multivorans]MBP1919018.1 glycosyltransferase involved in cell wall biosynthesis [Youngiibacter multivorans]